MRTLLLAAILALATPQAPTQTNAANAVIEGRVLRVGSLDPIPNFQVTLVKPNPSGSALSPEAQAALDSLQLTVTSLSGSLAADSSLINSLISSREQALGLAPGTLVLPPQTSALTDDAGHFSFKDLPPGKYTVRATKEGFFGPPANGNAPTSVSKPITIEAQKPVPSSDFLMIKGGIVSGRIREPGGQPASGVQVGAFRVTYGPNGRTFWSQTSSKQTDDRGEYRMFWLGPGEYYIGVVPRTVGTIPSPQDSWLRTFFPGVSEPSSATMITIKDGSEITGIDFGVQATSGLSTYKISGKATNPLPNVKPNPTTGVIDRTVSTFVLTPHDPGVLDGQTPPQSQNSLPVASRPNGEFEIRNVRPGSYDLFTLFLDSPIRRYYTSRTPIEVRNSDLDGLNLAISPGVPLSGQVTVAGTAATPIKLDALKVSLRSLDTLPGPFASIIGSIQVDAAGKFTTSDVPEARYTFALTGLPDSAYVSDIRQGTASVFDSGAVLGNQSPGPIQIVVSTSGQTVKGTVLNAQRKPAASAMVVLVPPAAQRQNAALYRNASTDELGKFTLRAVPPGDYTMYAWENVPFSAWMNADFLAKNQDRGKPIVVAVDSSIDTQLDLIPDAIGAR